MLLKTKLLSILFESKWLIGLGFFFFNSYQKAARTWQQFSVVLEPRTSKVNTNASYSSADSVYIVLRLRKILVESNVE